jgi:hypothetical protein
VISFPAGRFSRNRAWFAASGYPLCRYPPQRVAMGALQPASINNAAAINPVLIIILRYPHCYKCSDINVITENLQEKAG